jgi:integrase
MSCGWTRSVRAKRPQRLPVILSREEVRAVLRRLDGTPRLMAYLVYGAGLRLLECCRLRVQDVDFASNQIVVRAGKGDKDRVTMLPAVVKPHLARHLARVREQHRCDLEAGAGWVELPTAPARKYPNAGREWCGSGSSQRRERMSTGSPGEHRHHHLHESVLQRAVKQAVWHAGIAKRPVSARCATRSPRTCSRAAATSGSFRNSWVTRDVSTTQIYTHVLNRGPSGVRSPLDGMLDA